MFLKNKPFSIFGITSFFYLFILFFNYNNKTLLILLFILLLIYYLLLKNFSLSLFLVYIISSILQVGKTYIIELIPPSLIKSDLYPEGRITSFIIKPSDVMAVIMLFLLIKNFLKKRALGLPKNKIFIFLISAYLWIMISSIYSLNPEVSLLFSLTSLPIIIFVLFAKTFINIKKNINSVLALIAGIACFEGILTIIQFIQKSPMGSSIESSGMPLFGQSVDENRFFYRPIGTFGHANELANFILPYLLILLSYFYTTKQNKINFNLRLAAIFFSLIILILTASRSAWISFALAFLILTFLIEKKYHYKLNLTFLKTKSFIVSLIIFIFFSALVLPWRLLQSFYSLEEAGGFTTRTKLLQEAFNLIKQKPFWGVGLGMSIPAMFKQNLSGMMSFFPEAVHNGFINIILETGFPTLLLLILFLLDKWRYACKIFKGLKRNYKILSLGLLSAEISLLINMLFQPFNNFGNIIFINALFVLLI